MSSRRVFLTLAVAAAAALFVQGPDFAVSQNVNTRYGIGVSSRPERRRPAAGTRFVLYRGRQEPPTPPPGSRTRTVLFQGRELPTAPGSRPVYVVRRIQSPPSPPPPLPSYRTSRLFKPVPSSQSPVPPKADPFKWLELPFRLLTGLFSAERRNGTPFIDVHVPVTFSMSGRPSATVVCRTQCTHAPCADPCAPTGGGTAGTTVTAGTTSTTTATATTGTTATAGTPTADTIGTDVTPEDDAEVTTKKCSEDFVSDDCPPTPVGNGPYVYSILCKLLQGAQYNVTGFECVPPPLTGLDTKCSSLVNAVVNPPPDTDNNCTKPSTRSPTPSPPPPSPPPPPPPTPLPPRPPTTECRPSDAEPTTVPPVTTTACVPPNAILTCLLSAHRNRKTDIQKPRCPPLKSLLCHHRQQHRHGSQPHVAASDIR